MYKAVIFDFNGTLFEDYIFQEEAWRTIVRKYFNRDMSSAEFLESFYGLGNVDILAYLNSLDPEKQLDIAVTDEKEQVYRQICLDHPETVHFVPGVIETFEALTAAGIPIAICTASEITNVEFYYKFFHLERWFPSDRIIYDDRTLPIKPAPDVYLRAMTRMKLAPCDCVICEDSKNGLLAAVASGAGRVIQRQEDPSGKPLLDGDQIYAVIHDFIDFYPKYLE